MLGILGSLIATLLFESRKSWRRIYGEFLKGALLLISLAEQKLTLRRLRITASAFMVTATALVFLSQSPKLAPEDIVQNTRKPQKIRTDAKVFPEVASASVRFVQLDTTTKGNWKSSYGGDGYNTVNDSMSYPSYVNVKVSGHSSPTWTSATTDVRAPERIFGSDRVAARWDSISSFTVDIDLTDGLTHRVAIYCLDWDGNNRSQRLDVVDAGTNVVMDTRSISSFNGGQYLVWDLQGHVKIRVNRTGAKTAVVSGLYSKLIA